MVVRSVLQTSFIYAFRLWRMFAHQVGIPILMYHRICEEESLSHRMSDGISPLRFEAQMRFLKLNGYFTLSLGQVVDWMNGKIDLPKKSVCLTFDDGYRDNYYNAFPILRKYDMKATVFIAADQIGKELWYSPGVGKWSKRMPDHKRALYFEFLLRDQIREMVSQGISFQVHTCSHPHLTWLPLSEVRDELRNSKEALEKEFGEPVEFFAYPYGDFNNQVRAAVVECNFRGACSTLTGLNFPGDDSFLLKRIGIIPTGDIQSFQLQLHNSRYDKFTTQMKTLLKGQGQMVDDAQ